MEQFGTQSLPNCSTTITFIFQSSIDKGKLPHVAGCYCCMLLAVNSCCWLLLAAATVTGCGYLLHGCCYSCWLLLDAGYYYNCLMLL